MSKDLEARQQVKSQNNVQFRMEYKDKEIVFHLIGCGKPEKILAELYDKRWSFF